MSSVCNMSAEKALTRLKSGNEKYLDADVNSGCISRSLRLQTYQEGQTPYVVIVTCSDSRVIPESIFSAGIGELFTIRVAGNVMGEHELGSVEYACGHLGCRLVVVLGHTNCGAVAAAMEGGAEGYIGSITDEIQAAIGDEKNDYKAGCLNVDRSVLCIRKNLDLPEDVRVIGAMYHTDTGCIEFIG